jgi:hypothetical protein
MYRLEGAFLEKFVVVRISLTKAYIVTRKMRTEFRHMSFSTIGPTRGRDDKVDMSDLAESVARAAILIGTDLKATTAIQIVVIILLSAFQLH